MNTEVPTNLNTSLSSLALLSLRMGEGNDYLDYLYGFVVGALHRMNATAFNAEAIQQVIRSEFGLTFPVATIALYLKRLQKPKYIEPTPDGHQFKVLRLPKSTVSADRQAASGRINEALRQLRAFAASKYQTEWTDERTASALTDFIREYSIEFVRHIEFRSPLPDPGKDIQTDRFIIASFIKHTAESNVATFESIKTLVESHILANALLCPDLKGKGTGYKGVVFVLDTRFLLKAFDLEAPVDAENTRRLLESIRKLKGILCVFPETKDEIRVVLNGIKRGFMQGGARGPVVEELRKRGRGVADVILVESRLEDRLKALNVSTLPAPSYDATTFRFQIDEVALRAELEEELGYALGRAADHDIHAVRSIIALRQGRRVLRLEDAGYVFVTTNTTLSRAAYKQQRAEEQGWIFSAVITDFHLSHLTWLKAPIEAGELSRTELLSSCHAAMRPPQSVWRQYVIEVDRLKGEGRFSEQDHEILRLSLKAPEELMEVTQGEVSGITEANLRTILNRLEQTYAEEKQAEIERLKSEQQRIQKDLDGAQLTVKEREALLAAAANREREILEQAAKKEQALKDEAATREHALREQAQRTDAENERLRAERQSMLDREQRLRARIDRIANHISTWCYIAAWLIFTVFTVFALFSNFNPWFAVPAAFVGLLNIAAGFSGKSIRAFVRARVERQLRAIVE